MVPFRITKHVEPLLTAAIFGSAGIVLCHIISYGIYNSNYAENAWQDPVWRNMSAALNVTQEVLIGHIVNNTWNPDDHLNNKHLDFDARGVARGILHYVMMVPVQYFWHLWLERMWPGRPHEHHSAKSIRGGGDEKSAMLEDEMIRTLVEKGKVKRPSLSIINTLIKWVLDITVGRIITSTLIVFVLRIDLDGGDVPRSEYLLYTVFNLVYSWLSARPLSSLLSMILVPAHRRILFIEAMDIVGTAFKCAFEVTVVPWLYGTEPAQLIMQRITATRWNEVVVQAAIKKAEGLYGGRERMYEEIGGRVGGEMEWQRDDTWARHDEF
ncbi:hypothetical protein VHEMI04549 [[Torrubiella] hemipterigena]|uniref:Uncharacterized protein n=1 Tax=[Torrubiella] hemipterigena TaxID=1531966 RepID=A0A0A1SVN7_9HYPO|nr:hypothetical protein VHEMI04549 [[Torrubiella] hemipterigena]